MNRDEYLKMHEAEDRMWWYRGLHANLLTALDRAGPLPPGPVLDAGCGTGGFLRRLARARPGTRHLGLDFAPVAAALAAEKSGAAVCVGSINAPPFAAGSLAAIVSADVLCHSSVEPATALAELHRCLAPGGVLVLNLPAYGWMMSAHDRAVHTARRYTAGGIRRDLHAAGFRRVATRYWNSLPFPLMVIRRKLVATRGSASDVMAYPPPAEALFRAVMRIENWLLRHGMALPFGGSVLAVAVK